MTTPPSAPPTPDDELAAAQAALAGVHACVYGYGVAGARLDDAGADLARAALTAHRQRRDALAAQIVALDGEPIAALPAYALPFPVADETSARNLAAHLEQHVAPLFADLVAASGAPELRTVAAAGLIEASVRVTDWTGTTTAFPGLDGRPGAPTPPSTMSTPDPTTDPTSSSS